MQAYTHLHTQQFPQWQSSDASFRFRVFLPPSSLGQVLQDPQEEEKKKKQEEEEEEEEEEARGEKRREDEPDLKWRTDHWNWLTDLNSWRTILNSFVQ